MKNKTIKIIAMVLLLAMAFTLGVNASGNVKAVTAHINYAFKMKYDNVEWNPTEADGSAIRPLIYNGRTYLPLRTIGEKLGVAIDFDSETSTVLIGEKEWTPVTAEMVDCFSGMGYTKDSDMLYNGNGVYDFGLFVSQDWIDNQFTEMHIKVGGKFSKIKMSGYCTGANKTITFTDSSTKSVLKTVTLKDGVATDFEFDIADVKTIDIRWGGNDANSLVFGDVYVK